MIRGSVFEKVLRCNLTTNWTIFTNNFLKNKEGSLIFQLVLQFSIYYLNFIEFFNTYLCIIKERKKKKKNKIKLSYDQTGVPFKIKLVLNRLSLRCKRKRSYRLPPHSLIFFSLHIHISKKQMQLKECPSNVFHASTSISTIHIFRRVTGSLISLSLFSFFSLFFFFLSLFPPLSLTRVPIPSSNRHDDSGTSQRRAA